MSRRLLTAAAVVLALSLGTAGGASAAAVTYGNDSLRTGWYPDQGAVLTPQLVTGDSFGQLFSTAVDGQVFGQPLVSNDTLFVGTEKNNIYGLNPRSGAVNWSRNVGTPWNSADLSCSDIAPTVGITGTPVIDSGTGTAYFFAKSYVSGNSGPARWDAHAVDVTTGQERPGFPVQISGPAQNNPLTTFDATHEHQRPGLLLMDGVVYAAFGGHCDRAPFQGWVVGISTDGQVKAKWVALGGQNGAGAGIWHSGGGIVSDGPGRIIIATGNGGSPDPGTPPAPNQPPPGIPGSTPPQSLGQSVVRLQVQADGSLHAADFFAPSDAAQLDTWDADLGSGGPVALPSQYFGNAAHPHLMVQYGKRGWLYVLDRDHLGGIARGPAGGDDVLSKNGTFGGIWSRPAVWPGDGGYLYVPNTSGATETEIFAGNLKVFRYGETSNGLPVFTDAGTSADPFGYGSSSPIVTSSGTTSGSAIVWIVWAGSSGAQSQLRAYSAVPLNNRPPLLWSAPVGSSTKFTPPGVAGGRVYVGTRDHVVGFGSPVEQPLTSTGVGFPDTTTGSSSAPQTAHLTATRTVTVTGASVTGADFQAGQPSPNLPTTLAKDQTLDVPVTFSPTTTGVRGGVLNVATSDGNVAVGLSGNGRAPAAKLNVTPPLISFGGARVGSHVQGSFTIENVGSSPMTIQGVDIPAPAGPFSLPDAPAAGTVIDAGHSVVVPVSFDPKAAGSFNGQADVRTNAGDHSIGLSGSAAEGPHLDITPGSLDFAEVQQGDVATRSFEIRNSGGVNLTIMKSKPPDGGTFAAGSEVPEGMTLAPGQSHTVLVEFHPTSAGIASDKWELTGDDDTGPQSLTLTGRGAETPNSGGTQQADPAAGTPSQPLLPALTSNPFTPVRPPTVTRLRLSPSRYPAHARRVRPRITFNLSRRAPVVLEVERRMRCVARIGRCWGFEQVGSRWSQAGRRGANSLALPIRIGAPGRYRLTVTPAGGAGRSAAFRVTAR